MTEKEICGSYRRADNKMTQIKILSELTLKSEYEIMSIVVRNGYELPPKIVARLTKRLDTLDSRIWNDEQEYKEIYRALTGARKEEKKCSRKVEDGLHREVRRRDTARSERRDPDRSESRQFRHVPQRNRQAGSPVRGDVRAVRSDQQIRADGKL